MQQPHFGNEYFGNGKSGKEIVKKEKSLLRFNRKSQKNSTLKGLARKGKNSGMEAHQSQNQ